MTKEVEEWMSWAQNNDKTVKPLTRSQWRLAEYVLADEKLVAMLEEIGDPVSTIKQIQYYLKNK